MGRGVGERRDMGRDGRIFGEDGVLSWEVEGGEGGGEEEWRGECGFGGGREGRRRGGREVCWG